MPLATIYVQYTEVLHSSLFIALLVCTCVQLQIPSKEVEANTYVLFFMGKIVGKHFQIFLPHIAYLMSAISCSWGIAVLVIVCIPMPTVSSYLLQGKTFVVFTDQQPSAKVSSRKRPVWQQVCICKTIHKRFRRWRRKKTQPVKLTTDRKKTEVEEMR